MEQALLRKEMLIGSQLVLQQIFSIPLPHHGMRNPLSEQAPLRSYFTLNCSEKSSLSRKLLSPTECCEMIRSSPFSPWVPAAHLPAGRLSQSPPWPRVGTDLLFSAWRKQLLSQAALEVQDSSAGLLSPLWSHDWGFPEFSMDLWP